MDTIWSKEWSEEFPSKEGCYWLYGDYGIGSMGKHFRDDFVPEMKLHFVKIQKLPNGLMGVCDGQPIFSAKFNKRNEGWLGKWTPAILPELFEVHLRDTETDVKETLCQGTKAECLKFIEQNHSKYKKPCYLDLFDELNKKYVVIYLPYENWIKENEHR